MGWKPMPREDQCPTRIAPVGHWCLGLDWSLGLGHWRFVPHFDHSYDDSTEYSASFVCHGSYHGALSQWARSVPAPPSMRSQASSLAWKKSLWFPPYIESLPAPPLSVSLPSSPLR